MFLPHKYYCEGREQYQCGYMDRNFKATQTKQKTLLHADVVKEASHVGGAVCGRGSGGSGDVDWECQRPWSGWERMGTKGMDSVGGGRRKSYRGQHSQPQHSLGY
ncbi:hypothetical protein E2C01_018734 [Portunus trituberculatus]|uniref:Uncharacterized protein n=1 Tax=Portunus trituberculatus TaxID=210409 RepID=A0A5B7DXX2_PORTR|nr:hypothetical protein [Portunus trituberculatus]